MKPSVVSKGGSRGGFSGGYFAYREASASLKQKQTDGWLSDDATADGNSVTEIEEGSYRKLTIAAMTSADDSDLYDDFKSVWLKNSKQLSPTLRSTLYSIFRKRPDVYTFLLHCVRRSNERQSITKQVLPEFMQYKEKFTEKNAVPVPQMGHQLEALQACTRSHPTIFGDVCSIFNLDTAPLDSKIQLIRTLLQTPDKHKEVRKLLSYTRVVM